MSVSSRRRALLKSGVAPPPEAGVTVNDLVEDVWGPPKRDDGVASFNGIAPAAHDGSFDGLLGLLPGFYGPDFYVDWGRGAKYKAEIPVNKHINVWGHVYCRSAEKRFSVEFTYPKLYFCRNNLATGPWVEEAPPNPGSTSLYKQWISPSFKFESTSTFPVVSAQTANGHTLQFDKNRPQEYSFFHWAWNTYFPRKAVPPEVVSISVQCGMRIVNTPEAPTVDLSTVNCIGSISSDIYSNGENDAGGSSNPAIGIPKYKRITGVWREVGFTMMTEEALRTNPPPRITLPA